MISRKNIWTKRAKISYFEILTLMIATFAFSYMVYETTIISDNNSPTAFGRFLESVFSFIEKPMFTMASALPSECCQLTKEGAQCINSDPSDCVGSQHSPTSCESTSYCKLGTCYDSSEGICMDNTPQYVCNANGGTWADLPVEQVPQCQLGCCIIADQAAFVPLVRCKRLATFFGVPVDYRNNIGDEVSCIATAQGQDTGACVYQQDFETTCKFTTRADCNAPEGIINVTNTSNLTAPVQKTFYKDMLCSAEELGTNCARQASTGCYQGKVHWYDSCGNRENVYSSNKDKSWNSGKALADNSVCALNDGTNKDCGNCDYLQGARCATYDNTLPGFLNPGRPTYGNNICKKTDCIDKTGKTWKNGESWCQFDTPSGNGTDPVGARYYRDICVDGTVQVEPCADYRNEICIQGTTATTSGNFASAACRVNRWQDCTAQIRESDCNNTDMRDCIWLPPVTGLMLGAGQTGGISVSPGAGTATTTSTSSTLTNPSTSGSFTNPTATGSVVAPITGYGLFGGSDSSSSTNGTTTNRPGGVCVPDFPPGLQFWQSGDAQTVCGQASLTCVVGYEKRIIGSKTCVTNCDCLTDSWAQKANQVCTALGDCGGYVNIQGKYTEDGYDWKVNGQEKKFTPNQINQIVAPFTGKVVASIMTGSYLAPVTGEVTGPVTLINPVKVGAGGGTGNLASYSGNALTEKGAEALATSSSKGSFLIGDKFTMAQQADGSWLVNSGSGSVTLTAQEGQAFAAAQGLQITTLNANQAWLSEALLGKSAVGSFESAALGAIQWAAIAYGIGYLIGSIAGMSAKNTQALSTSLAAAAGIYEGLASSDAFINAVGASYQLWAAGIGIGIGVAIFLYMYKSDSQQTVTFQCMPWQAPKGGDDCSKCNDPLKPCTEYRCKSLGGSCDVVNQGTAQESCVSVDRNDVQAPVITPDATNLTVGYKYTDITPNPPSPGFRIVNTNNSNGCVKPFTPLEFGVSTNEPAQCKIDFNHTTKMADMQNWFGETNLYLYNHTEQMVLPSVQAFQNSSLVLENGQTLNLFVRCIDKMGNQNSDEYNIRFCIDPSPDTTAPEIKATSIVNGACVAETKSSANVNFYTNEPADCKWSHEDKSYDNMENTMICNDNPVQMNALMLYTCVSNLTGIPLDGTDFYVRCRDQPGAPNNDRNTMAQSYDYKLKGSTGLKLKNVAPNGTIYGSVSPFPVTISAETYDGCDDNKAICYYSTDDVDSHYVQFYTTNTDNGLHSQRQDLAAGTYTYYVKCVDSGGNVAKNSTTFTLDVEAGAPMIARTYQEGDKLKIVTVRNSKCAYSFNDCDFTFKDGTPMPYDNSTTHVATWKQDQAYYIKCKDDFTAESSDCSMIIQPTKNFLSSNT